MSKVLYCGDLHLAGLSDIGFSAHDRFIEAEYHSSMVDFTNISKHVTESSTEQESRKPLNISYICSGGEEVTYSLFFLNGHEHKYFLQAVSRHLVKQLQAISFDDLFDEMIKKKSYSNTPQDLDHEAWIKFPSHALDTVSRRDSREMKQIVCHNKNRVLFEMMDGKLYFYNMILKQMYPFAIPDRGSITCIGSGTMSPFILVNTVNDQDNILTFNTDRIDLGATEGKNKIAFPNKPAEIKFMKCYCRQLFIFVLKNNYMYAFKGAGCTSIYGFENIPQEVVSRVVTGFENEGNIIGIDTGFAHVAVLLDNGAVYTMGLNNFGQLSQPVLRDEDTVMSFVKIALKVPSLAVCCGSTCTCVLTTSDIIFFGEVKNEFILTDPVDQEYKSFTRFWVHKKQYSDQDVSLGPWHGFIYRNSFHVKKFNTHFIHKLGEKVNNEKLSDIVLGTIND
ncbi:hypothetical protein C9374_004443 [Naegleria lovaniensis]|uniref:Uncharacterized protein n=1 Tax=Naegleria lovaniensis TaxID=51637 RepID=A0AA88KNY6_NAELO|nr:uncharacterized protein C9374_004443 [Naegleria lovaniensis]KAG2383106.1 hypothetical protein C9374_004443 [Naegleria lovaniensis]